MPCVSRQAKITKKILLGLWSTRCLETPMILGKPAPFVRAFVDAVDDAIREHHPSHAMSATQRTWLAFCVTAVLVTNSICWARFERAQPRHLCAGSLVLDVSTQQDTLGPTAGGQCAGHRAAPWHHLGQPCYRRYRQPALKIGQGPGLSL